MSSIATISSSGSASSTAQSHPRATPIPITRQRSHRKRSHNPNFYRPYIAIYGPFHRSHSPSSVRIHHSDYIDFNDHRLFYETIRRIAAAEETHQHPTQITRTAKSFLNSLRSFTLSSIPQSPRPNSCPICTEEIGASSIISQLPCEHVFHYDCILPWLYRSNLCPMCRFALPKETVSGPLRRYMVRIGDAFMEGCGRDRESGFWDAVLTNGLDVRVSPDWFSSPGSTLEGSAQGRPSWPESSGGNRGMTTGSESRLGQDEMTGPENSGETVMSPV